MGFYRNSPSSELQGLCLTCVQVVVRAVWKRNCVVARAVWKRNCVVARTKENNGDVDIC